MSTCSAPVADTSDRSQWSDLVAYRPPASSLSSVITKVQDMDADAIGDINNDFYGVTIDYPQGESAADVLKAVRTSLSGLTSYGSQYAVAPYDDANGTIWNSDNYVGAIMTFDLINVFNLTYKGDVVASCASDTDWIFSTVQTPKSGWHPVCGNRAFGVQDNGDGSATIWTKGADRAVNNGALYVPHQTETGRGATFLAGEQVWNNL